MPREVLRFSVKTIARMLWEIQRKAMIVNGATHLTDANIEQQLNAAKDALDSLITEYYESRGCYDSEASRGI